MDKVEYFLRLSDVDRENLESILKAARCFNLGMAVFGSSIKNQQYNDIDLVAVGSFREFQYFTGRANGHSYLTLGTGPADNSLSTIQKIKEIKPVYSEWIKGSFQPVESSEYKRVNVKFEEGTLFDIILETANSAVAIKNALKKIHPHSILLT